MIFLRGMLSAGAAFFLSAVFASVLFPQGNPNMDWDGAFTGLGFGIFCALMVNVRGVR